MTLRPELDFIGLAPFLRLSIAGGDLRQVAQALLEQAQQDQDNPSLWMNLATAFFTIGERELGLTIQAQALQTQRRYTLPARRQPARCRLLVLQNAGDLAENTPIDCLLEDSDVELIYQYVSAAEPLPADLPEHDAILVGLSVTDTSQPILDALVPLLANWPKPVINAPQYIPNVEREAASALLQDVPGLLIPATWPVDRATLAAIADGSRTVEDAFPGGRFPLILRPIGSHGGHGLARIDTPAEVDTYLAAEPDDSFYLSNFIDYSGADGLFRKLRVALIDGLPFACHMGVSSHWMIHYLNAGMYEDAAKRAAELAFMEGFADFAARHATALEAIHRRSGLDYICIDCAETRDGELLIFEIDHAMVVHAMDPEELFPYKQVHMLKVKQAFEDYLYRLQASQPKPL
jgi:glutathione synthase/RimK-type ligase-like ATP-grasp enzyme